MSPRRAARRLNVRERLLFELVKGGHLERHEHKGRIGVTPEQLDELRWKLAIAKMGEAA